MGRPAAAEERPAARRGRIAHVSVVHPALDGRIFYREAQSLRALGYEVAVFGLHPTNECVEGVPVHPVKVPCARWLRFLTSWWTLLKIMSNHRADVYHIHDPELLPASLLAKMLLRRRVVFDAHEDVSLTFLKEYLRGWLKGPLARVMTFVVEATARRIDGVVTCTRLLHEAYEPFSRRVVTFVNYPAPRFIAEAEAARRPFSERRNEIVHVGTLRTERLRFLMDVLSRFLERHQEWSAVLMGMHEPQRRWFEQNVSGEMRGRLTVIGKIPHLEVPHRLCMAKIGINYHPLDSRQVQVAIPVKVFEYMVCGLPVVTTRLPLLVEVVKDCPAVALVDEDAGSYLAALEAMAERSDLAALGREAQRFSAERFDCLAQARELADFYEAIRG